MRGNPNFIEFFQACTPVSELGRMNIGSRPAKRKAAGSIDDLRAIPWIFAWTQIRFHLPVWLGIGQAFEVVWRRRCLLYLLSTNAMIMCILSVPSSSSSYFKRAQPAQVGGEFPGLL